jgi:hypothetical protein
MRQIPDSFEKIECKDLLPGDLILFYGGNKLTKWHGAHRREEFGTSSNAPYHAAIVYDVEDMHDLPIGPQNVYILDQELTGTLGFLEEHTKDPNKRIDIIRVPAEPALRKAVKDSIRLLAEEESVYDWKGYFAFISQMPYCGWLKIIKPSKKTYFCSDSAASCWDSNGIQVSPRDHNLTAPVDLQLFGMDHFKMYTLNTLPSQLNAYVEDREKEL